MRKILYTLIFLSFGFRCVDKKGCRFENGNYNVVYDEQFKNYSSWEFKMEGERIVELTTDSASEFKIEWISDSRFKLEPTELSKEPLSEVERELESLGDPFYKITDCDGDSISFELRRNEHIIINSGKIIKRQ